MADSVTEPGLVFLWFSLTNIRISLVFDCSVDKSISNLLILLNESTDPTEADPSLILLRLLLIVPNVDPEAIDSASKVTCRGGDVSLFAS